MTLDSGDDEFQQMDMSTFLMASAHDMKNSISVMTAFLENALGEMQPKAEGDACCMTHQALYEAQRLNTHLVQVLALYKIKQGLYPFDPTEVELASFAKEVVGRVGPLAAAKQILLKTETDPDERYWYFDYELVLSAVVQSLHNAIKYTRDQVHLSLRIIDGQLEVRVEDNGAGFPDYMLERGFPVAHGIDSVTGSTGLGLYFSRKVANLHRNRGRAGNTSLKNGGHLGGGCFILTLP
ncbi:MAG: HAMP domain-containing histidine kinase [Zoogloea sp.]|nr:HAMP domain-containing histidine kinase [Zoogloea sp.]